MIRAYFRPPGRDKVLHKTTIDDIPTKGDTVEEGGIKYRVLFTIMWPTYVELLVKEVV